MYFRVFKRFVFENQEAFLGGCWQCHFAWLHRVFNFCILRGTLLKIKTGKDFHLDQYRSLLMNISHEVQVDLFPLFAWLHQKDGIMFTVGNVDHYIDRYIGRCSGWQSIDTWSTLGQLSIDSWPTGDWVWTECRLSIDRLLTTTSTDIAVDITYSKHDAKDGLAHPQCKNLSNPRVM